MFVCNFFSGPGPPTSMHHQGPPGSMHHPTGFGYRGPPPTSMPQGLPDGRAGASPNPPSHLGGPSSLGHLPGPNPHGPQNLGPPTTIGGPSGPNHQNAPPSHLGGQSHLGPQSHLNQLGRPPGLTNPLGPPPHGPQSMHDGSTISHIPTNPLRIPPNSHGAPPNMGGTPNMDGPRFPLDGSRNPLDRSNLGASQIASGSLLARAMSPAPGTSGMKHGAPRPTGPSVSPHDEPPIKIKAEVKAEPEYR